MCSVVGSIGHTHSDTFVLEGLERLEYRGYDSAGIACLHAETDQLVYMKSEGRLSNLKKKLKRFPFSGSISIGHTRWATHGIASEQNAHPHFDCQKSIAVVHNGIIENHAMLKQTLLADGHTFHSATDTEVIAHLLEASLAQHALPKRALLEVVNQLDGAYALIGVVQQQPDCMFVARKRSPLCIGIGRDGMFVASDVVAFAGKTNEVLFMPDESFALVRKERIELFDFTGIPLPLEVQTVNITWSANEKQGYEHFMLKEIYEQKEAVRATIRALEEKNETLWPSLGLTQKYVKQLSGITLLGCGTSWYAARIAQFFFESICKLPTRVHLASEFRYMPFFSTENQMMIAVSQSGETADTLEALRLVHQQALPTIGVTNVASSTLVRETNGCLITQAGPEIAVASTKAFSTQLATLFWFAHRLAYERGTIDAQQLARARDDVLIAAEVLEGVIESYKVAIEQRLAAKYAQFKQFIFLGRHIGYPFAMEVALKLKEISYIFAQCYPAGELKHGPIALIDKTTPIVLISNLDPVTYQKLVVNAQEVKARGGHLLVFAFAGQDELCSLADELFVLPRVNPLLGPLAMTGLAQFFVYQIALKLGRSIDKPRNLAKSVTVE